VTDLAGVTVGHSPTDRALGGVSMRTTDGEPASIGHFFARALLAVALGVRRRSPRLRRDPGHEPVYRGHEYRSPKTLRVHVD
jgi:hypothetical protein